MLEKNRVEYKITAQRKYHMSCSGYQGITFLYVLKGVVKITCNDFCQTLYQGDILLVNQNEPYQLDSQESNIIITLELADYYCARYYQSYFRHRYFLGNIEPSDIKKQYIDNIQLLLANIMVSHLKEANSSLLEINHFISHLLLILITFFRNDDIKFKPSDTTYSKKIKKTIEYIEEHYNEHVTLQEVAKHEYISISYLSRLFKKEVGIGFNEYLNDIKFKHAVYDLINTKLPIYSVAEKHGFFDAKQFTKLFKKYYQTTPQKYRFNYQSNNKNIFFNNLINEKKNDIIEESVPVAELLPLLINIINDQKLIPTEYSPYYNQIIDLKKSSKYENIPKIPYIIFIGELQELLKEHVKQQITLLKKTTHINYVEVSHLISGSTILPELITDEPTPTHSPYYNSDLAISFLYKHDIALFVRIYHNSIKVFKEDYINKVIKFFKHCTHLYGVDYVKKWQFIYYIEESEFNNEDIKEIKNSFARIKKTIKSCLPDSKVGLFCPIIDHEGNIELYGENQLLKDIDFIGYSSTPQQYSDKLDLQDTPLYNNVMFQQKKAKKIKSYLKKEHINMPIYLMKWNTFTGNTRHTNGSYFRGALIFQTLLTLFPYVNSIGIVLNTELQQEENKPNFIDITRIALFYLFNTKRPIFYVLKFLDKLNGKIIAQSSDYLITENTQGYQVIITNVSIFNPHISIQEHLTQNFKQQRLISVTGLKPGEYQVKKYIFDQKNGAVYQQYLSFATKFGYDEEIIESINRNTVPSLSVYDDIIKDKWEVLTNLDVNAIHFYELKKFNDYS